jgi:alpha-D-ribose 1-methylphosphonate 5-triphosphate synthase subunit PhnI
MYVAVKGGERAIDAAHEWLAEARRGDPGVPELSVAQIREQLALAVSRVMAEGSLYDPDLAALALKQARGDMIEAIFLIRAWRTTLPRFGGSVPIDTGAMACERRISATYKDAPGGQVLGPTFDYTHRLLDFALAAEGEAPAPDADPGLDAGLAAGPGAPPEPKPKIADFLGAEGLLQSEPRPPVDAPPPDLTREPLELPASRALRLQALARGDEGFALALAYSTQRGYGQTHAFVGELRLGDVEVEMEIPELGFSVAIASIAVTECETVNKFDGSKTVPPQFSRGYGLTLGHNERKAISMALVDRALRWREMGQDFTGAPAQDEEFVLSHLDNIQASGFLEHIKLPHYVDFQAELSLVRKMRAEISARNAEQETARDVEQETARDVEQETARDVEQETARDAERETTRDAARTAARDAEQEATQ